MQCELKANFPWRCAPAYLALHRVSDSRFAEHGVTADQFVLLATLERGEAFTQRELAKRMSSDPSTVRAMLVLLERNGLVERRSHPTDARARTVSLTPAGERKFRALWEAGESIRKRMLEVLGYDEASALVEMLTRVSAALSIASVDSDRPARVGSS